MFALLAITATSESGSPRKPLPVPELYNLLSNVSGRSPSSIQIYQTWVLLKEDEENDSTTHNEKDQIETLENSFHVFLRLSVTVTEANCLE